MTRGTKRDPSATIEDLQFILSTGGSMADAARRLGFPTLNALQKWLRGQRGK